MKLVIVMVLIIMLIVIYYVFSSNVDNFNNFEMNYESINNYKKSTDPYDNQFYGHIGYLNPMDSNTYANKIATDLQQSFPNPSNPNTPSWDPSTYREVQTPSGQFIGQIQSN